MLDHHRPACETPFKWRNFKISNFLHIEINFIWRDIVFPHDLLKKRRGYCYHLRPSVRPSLCPLRYFLPDRSRKSKQIWSLSYLPERGMQQHTFFDPAPWGPRKRGKMSNIIQFQLQMQFQRFEIVLYQTLCVFSQIKYMGAQWLSGRVLD